MDCSIKRMIRCLEKEGIALKRVTAKVFGGSDMFQSRYDNGRSSVGAQNIQATYHALREIGMPVSACDVGGDVGRKIIFCSDTGDVFLKRLRVMNEEVPGVLQAISGFAGGVI
jgi:chemotaxis protein CheD